MRDDEFDAFAEEALHREVERLRAAYLSRAESARLEGERRQGEVDAARRDAEEAVREHAAAVRERDESRRHAAELEMLVDDMRASTSWRLTRGLRWLGRQVGTRR